jgi:hypothetical protein
MAVKSFLLFAKPLVVLRRCQTSSPLACSELLLDESILIADTFYALSLGVACLVPFFLCVRNSACYIDMFILIRCPV